MAPVFRAIATQSQRTGCGFLREHQFQVALRLEVLRFLDVRLAKNDDRIKRIIDVAKKNSLPIAPPTITDVDLAFFVDKSGTRHQVEMRGERTMRGIYFKAKDLGRVIVSDRLVDTILDPRNSYRESIDWALLLIPVNRGNKQDTPIGQNSATPNPGNHHSQ